VKLDARWHPKVYLHVHVRLPAGFCWSLVTGGGRDGAARALCPPVSLARTDRAQGAVRTRHGAACQQTPSREGWQTRLLTRNTAFRCGPPQSTLTARYHVVSL
jgi:hypothetical protein